MPLIAGPRRDRKFKSKLNAAAEEGLARTGGTSRDQPSKRRSDIAVGSFLTGDELPVCPSYAAVRETADGRSYVLEHQPSGRSSAVKRKYCLDRRRQKHRKVASRLRKSRKELSASRILDRVMQQGEFVLEKTFRESGDDDGRSEDDERELDKLRREFRTKPFRTVWLGVNSTELKCWDERFKNYQYGLQLGKGSFGSVHEACKGNNCRYVLKISIFADDFDKEVAEREIAIMEQLNDSGITPKLLNSKMCADKALMLMERFDMSAEQLGKQQYERFFGKGADVLKGSLMFTDKQIQQMFNLAMRLSWMGISHGDLKLDNLMYLLQEERFVVIDFGFTGTYQTHKGKFWDGRWGFTHAMGCSQQRPVPKELVPFVNVWQLILDLSTWPVVLVAIEDPQTKNVTEIRVLAGLGPKFKHTLNPHALKLIQKDCPHPRGDLYRGFKDFQHIRKTLLRKLQPYWV